MSGFERETSFVVRDGSVLRAGFRDKGADDRNTGGIHNLAPEFFLLRLLLRLCLVGGREGQGAGKRQAQQHLLQLK